jgi:hypothetical protein
MKTNFTILILLFSLNSLAQEMTCLDKLLPYNRYSGLHQVTKEEWTDVRDDFDSEGAKAALHFLVNSKLFCRQNELMINSGPDCMSLVPDVPLSHICFVSTNLGHFTMTRDQVRNFNFIFTKDKR